MQSEKHTIAYYIYYIIAYIILGYTCVCVYKWH